VYPQCFAEVPIHPPFGEDRNMADGTLPTQNTEPARNQRRRRIFTWILVSLTSLCLVLALLVLVSYKTFQHLYARAPDPLFTYCLDQTLKANIPAWFPVEVTVDETVPVKLSKLLELQVPIRKDVAVQLDDDFTVPLDVYLTIPIDQEIYVEAEVPVETMIPLDGIRVKADLWGMKKVALPLSGFFPVKTTIPLRQKIRVKTQVKVRLQEEITVHVTKQLTLPLDLNVKVKLPINDVFDVDFSENLTVNARVPEEIPVGVRMRLAISKEDGLTAN
jgi:hypothetical protein